MNPLELYMDQERLYCFEGESGVRKFEQVVNVLGYRDLREFLADNSIRTGYMICKLFAGSIP